MARPSSFILLTLLLLLAPRAEGQSVHWKASPYTADTLPAEIPEAMRAAIGQWASWAAANEYGLVVDPEAEVLFLYSNYKKTITREVKVIARTKKEFGALLAPLASDPAAAKTPVPWTSDAQALVLFRLANEKDLDLLLDKVKEIDGRYASWAEASKKNTGFVLEALGVSAWIEAPAGLEVRKVWRAENELVHRLTRLLVHRRYGLDPHWLATGISWHLEQTITGGLYSFPGRNEFVGVKEHSGWKAQLGETFRGRPEKALELAEIAGWQRGTWDEEAAAKSWGLVRFLAARDEKALALYLDDLGRAQRTGAVTTQADGSWKSNPDFAVPAEAQTEFLVARFGASALADASHSFAVGQL